MSELLNILLDLVRNGGFAIVSFGAAMSVIIKLIQNYYFDESDEGKEQTLEVQVEKLSASLKEATVLISTIEAEIKSRTTLVTQLKEDIETYNQIAELKKEEVDAISKVIKAEVSRGNSKSFWKGVAVNLILFLLGAYASYQINLWTMAKTPTGEQPNSVISTPASSTTE